MYSLQALWTQAREQLHVITIICANRTYAILKVTPACSCLPILLPTGAASVLSLTHEPSNPLLPTPTPILQHSMQTTRFMF